MKAAFEDPIGSSGRGRDGGRGEPPARPGRTRQALHNCTGMNKCSKALAGSGLGFPRLARDRN